MQKHTHTNRCTLTQTKRDTCHTFRCSHTHTHIRKHTHRHMHTRIKREKYNNQKLPNSCMPFPLSTCWLLSSICSFGMVSPRPHPFYSLVYLSISIRLSHCWQHNHWQLCSIYIALFRLAFLRHFIYQRCDCVFFKRACKRKRRVDI